MNFPKVLIIGYPFNKKSGGGITMSNLFHGWPKEKLALASNTYLIDDLDCSVCEKYYQLGYNGKLHPFPFNIILHKIKCGPININNCKSGVKQYQTQKKNKYKFVYKLVITILNYFGVYNVFYNLKITPEFKEWVIAYNPDIIYSQLSTLELIRFVSKLNELINKPIAIHIMDDWPVMLGKSGLFYFYWKRIVDKEFKQLLDKSAILMSICESMSEEYKTRYNKEFIPFHNPIDINAWLPFAKKDWTIKEKFTILYAGRIGRGIEKSIVDIAEAVLAIRNNYENIVFEIQTFDISPLKHLLHFNEQIRWIKPIEYQKLPAKFSSVDLLVLPEDFDSDSVEFLKYSIQTKVAEYMISGTPILVYADKRTAVSKYATKDRWAYVLNEKNIQDLAQAIKTLYSDLSLRKNLSEKAREAAIQNENAEIVRDNFQKSFILTQEMIQY